MWIFLLGCTSLGPIELCTSTGIWDLSTSEVYTSIQDAMESRVEDICLGPGTYAMPCGQFEDTPIRISGAGNELTELRSSDCPQAHFNAEGDYLLEDVAITGAGFFIDMSPWGHAQLNDVLVRDLNLDARPPESGWDDVIILAGDVDIDGLEVRDSVLPSGFFSMGYSGGTVQDLWVHDNLDRSSSSFEFDGIDLDGVRIEGNPRSDPTQNTYMLYLDNSTLRDLSFGDNADAHVWVNNHTTISEAHFFDSPGESGRLFHVESGSSLTLNATEVIQSGGVNLSRDATLFLQNTELPDLECPILCSETCLAPAAEVICPGPF